MCQVVLPQSFSNSRTLFWSTAFAKLSTSHVGQHLWSVNTLRVVTGNVICMQYPLDVSDSLVERFPVFVVCVKLTRSLAMHFLTHKPVLYNVTISTSPSYAGTNSLTPIAPFSIQGAKSVTRLQFS